MAGDLMCYNRGCGKTFDPRQNRPDSTACRHHPGSPFFHETYKGWTCCNKKSTDFTDFLNTPGCATGPHSREKPVEPDHITGKIDDRSLEQQLAELKSSGSHEATPEPVQLIRLPRPDWQSTPLVRISPVPSAAFKKSLDSQKTGSNGVESDACGVKNKDNNSSSSNEIKEGEPCKNGACKASYGSPSADSDCVHHPGVPIFHEGMKFWSCCQRKTSDFESFLNQAGCTNGDHRWTKDSAGSATVKCRYDWHQTATHVTIAIYAKKYDHKSVTLDLNPIRFKFHVYFPEEAGSFDLDLELKGVISVDDSSCTLTGTKIEIKLKKAEPGSWARLDVVRPVTSVKRPEEEVKPVVEEEDCVDALDLDDLDFCVRKPVLSSDASAGRTDAQII